MSIKELYQALGGNYEEALGRLYNDDLIKRFLKMFAANDFPVSLKRALDAKDARALFEAAHGLKGVAGNLALAPLYELSSSLCESTRGKEGFYEDDGTAAKLLKMLENTDRLIRENIGE